MTHLTPTHIETVATISRLVTIITDQVTGDRFRYPLLVANLTQHGLKRRGIDSNVLYGHAAWIEVDKQQMVHWAGAWGEEAYHFWVETSQQEIIDLSAAVSYRRSQDLLYSVPLLWSPKIPIFYRYHPEGIAELENLSGQDLEWLNLSKSRIDDALASNLKGASPTYPNEPILCPNLKLLDDSEKRFALFDRALSIHGLPEAPF